MEEIAFPTKTIMEVKVNRHSIPFLSMLADAWLCIFTGMMSASHSKETKLKVLWGLTDKDKNPDQGKHLVTSNAGRVQFNHRLKRKCIDVMQTREQYQYRECYYPCIIEHTQVFCNATWSNPDEHRSTHINLVLSCLLFTVKTRKKEGKVKNTY